MNSRTEPRKNKTSRNNNDYNKNELKHPDIEIAYSARSSGAIYRHKNGVTIDSKNCRDSIRPINDNHFTLEQHKIQELCLREISHQEKYTNCNVLGNSYPSYTDQTILS